MKLITTKSIALVLSLVFAAGPAAASSVNESPGAHASDKGHADRDPSHASGSLAIAPQPLVASSNGTTATLPKGPQAN